jgi:Flp pilus assembly protein TadG
MRTRRDTKFGWRNGISEDGSAGQAIVEFALVATVFIILLFGIIEFSRLMLMYHHVGNVAREGSRYAIVHGSDSLANATAADIENYVKSISPVDPNNLTVTTTWENPSHEPKSWVRVQVNYDFKFIVPILYNSNIPLQSTSQMVISY